MEPSRSGVGMSYEIQIQCTCDRLLWYDDFIDRLQSLFKFFDILTTFTKSNFHTMTISNVLLVQNILYSVGVLHHLLNLKKNIVNNGSDIAKKLNVGS